jgi:hypothetical protein
MQTDYFEDSYNFNLHDGIKAMREIGVMFSLKIQIGGGVLSKDL